MIIGFSHLSRPPRLRSSTTKTKSMMSSLWPLNPSIKLSPRHFNSMLAQVLLWDEGRKVGRWRANEIQTVLLLLLLLLLASLCPCCLFFNYIFCRDQWFVQSWTWSRSSICFLFWHGWPGRCHGQTARPKDATAWIHRSSSFHNKK